MIRIDAEARGRIADFNADAPQPTCREKRADLDFAAVRIDQHRFRPARCIAHIVDRVRDDFDVAERRSKPLRIAVGRIAGDR